MEPLEHIKQGNKYPYELTPGEDRTPPDWAHATARGVLHDLLGRRGIKHELNEVDPEVRKEIVASMAAIIREGVSCVLRGDVPGSPPKTKRPQEKSEDQ